MSVGKTQPAVTPISYLRFMTAPAMMSAAPTAPSTGLSPALYGCADNDERCAGCAEQRDGPPQLPCLRDLAGLVGLVGLVRGFRRNPGDRDRLRLCVHVVVPGPVRIVVRDRDEKGRDLKLVVTGALFVLHDQVEADFAEAMSLLPTKTKGGEWAKGRATAGAAAGYYARTLMVRHKYAEALTVLKDIMSTADGGNEKYGTYKLMANYGDNFREGSEYENNDESLFEIQFLDYGTQGVDDEWTPVNTSPNATQGSAIESNYGPGAFGGWADLSASPWLYNLFKAERTTGGSLDPRLYWTIGTYEPEWDGNAMTLGNVCYTTTMTATDFVVTNNDNGGLPIAKNTNLRTGLYDKVVTGLHDGINLRLMRYSDVLLRAAECENEINGPTADAFKWIDKVRNRAQLANLDQSKFNTKDLLFEQIANVERPKEFGCEFGRGFDLIRWGFFYAGDRLNQLKAHGAFNVWKKADFDAGKYTYTPKDPVDPSSCSKSSFNSYVQGHEFLPIFQNTLNDNPNLTGNSANKSTSNASYFSSKGWTIHQVPTNN